MPRKTPPSVEYTAWANMLSRCRPGRPDRDRYYDRGVRVCARWDPRQGGSYANFLADMGPKPGPDWSLDKDSVQPGNLLYAPGLVVWGDKSHQSTHRRNTVWLTYKGEKLCLQAWARKTGIKRSTLLRRLRLGWDTEKTLTTPVGQFDGRFKSVVTARS